MGRRKQVYKITYPNGKIYVGMDLTGILTELEAEFIAVGPNRDASHTARSSSSETGSARNRG